MTKSTTNKKNNNMLSRLVITYLPRSKHLLISWLQSPSAVILKAPKIKSLTVSPSICHGMMGPDALRSSYTYCVLIHAVLSCTESLVWLFITHWTVARQAPLSMGFFRQGSWVAWMGRNRLPFLYPGYLPDLTHVLLYWGRFLIC